MKEKIIAAGILAICPETERFLMLKRAGNLKFPLYWNLPGGSLDDDDKSLKVTAIREFKEETGYSKKIKISKGPLFVDKSNHIDFYTYVGILSEEFVPELNIDCLCIPENIDYKWVSLFSEFDDIEKITPNIVNYPPTAEPMGWASGVYSRTLDAS